MTLLSQQIRKAVLQSPTSTYAIARAADIDKSAMSRFMNGGSLTMEKLDRLAGVLGVSIQFDGVSLVPRPLEMGRPKQKERAKMDKKRAQQLADGFADDAFKNFFSSRRGIWHIEDVDCLLFYDNNPWENAPSVRPKQIEDLKRRLKGAGIKLLASGGSNETWDAGGKREPYSISLLLDCSVDRFNEVKELAEESLKEFWPSEDSGLPSTAD